MRRSSWSPCPRAACRATASTCAWSLVRARRVRVACTGLAAVAPAALSDARACRVCVAGKTVTVVVPDELQPGQVLAVRPRPALLPLLQRPTLRVRPSWEGLPVRTRTRALPCGRRPSARRDYTHYARYAHCAYCSQVTAPPKRKARPSDIARKLQRREDRRQRQLPSRGWADVDEPGG